MSTNLYDLRRNLKIKVYHQRRQFAEQPKCPICGKDITIEGGADLHEVFFTRGDVQGIKDAGTHRSIFNSCNVALVHQGDCHLQAQHTAEGKRKCAEQIITYEGEIPVTNYFERMRTLLKNPDMDTYELLYLTRIIKEMPKVAPKTMQPRWNF